MFNIVNDKQTTDELKMSIQVSIFPSWWNHFVSVLSQWSCNTQSLCQLAYISQSFSRPFCLKHSARHKKRVFPLNPSHDTLIVFHIHICKLITMAGQVQNILWGRVVMEWKPNISLKHKTEWKILFIQISNAIWIFRILSEVLKKERR